MKKVLTPETFDDEWIEWDAQALKEEIELGLDFLVDIGGISKYKVENVVGGYEPSADVSIIPVKAVDYITLSASITRDMTMMKEVQKNL